MKGGQTEALRASHKQEFDADSFGLELQFKSLPDSIQIVPGLVSAVYFCHTTALLDGRLMLLSDLADVYSWEIERTHPHALARLLRLMSTAESLHRGSGAGLREVDNSLKNVDMDMWDAANEQQEQITRSALGLISIEVSKRVSATERTRPGSEADELNAPLIRSPEAVQILLQYFNQSPLGVLRALERPKKETSEDLDTEEGRLRSLIVEQLALALPTEFQRFRRQTKAQRAVEMA